MLNWSIEFSRLSVVSGRLKHGRHFTFKSAQNDVAVTLVPCSVVGAIVTEEMPYAAHGPWLQVIFIHCDSYTAVLNNMMLVNGALMRGLLHLVQERWAQNLTSALTVPNNAVLALIARA